MQNLTKIYINSPSNDFWIDQWGNCLQNLESKTVRMYPVHFLLHLSVFFKNICVICGLSFFQYAVIILFLYQTVKNKLVMLFITIHSSFP